MRTIAKGLAAVALLQISLYAQQQNLGNIIGSVKDPSALVIPGASIVVRQQATGVETRTVTDQAGAYSFFPGLPIGTYTLTVSAPGFKTAVRSDVTLVAGVTLTFDLALVLGQVSEKIAVSARAEFVDTTSSSMGTTLSSEELTNLPLQLAGVERSSLDFLTTLSTVNYNPQGGVPAMNSANIEGSSGYGQNNYVGYDIDGVNATPIQFVGTGDQAPLLPDAVQEVRLASNFNAETGWNNGVQISVVSKSGTNQFHGSAYEYVQNNAMDARNWFSKGVSQEKQNEFGFTLGGPIRKNKTFFFGYLDFFRYRTTPAGVVASFPAAAMRNGDFSALLGPQIGSDQLGRPIYRNEIYDPSTTRQLPDGSYIRDPFMYNGQLNVINPALISPLSATFQKGYPLPNIAGTQNGTQNNWLGTREPSPVNTDLFFIKVDHEISSTQRLMVGFDSAPVYDTTSGSIALAPTIGSTETTKDAQYRLRISYTWSARPNMVFQGYLGGTYVSSTLSLIGTPAGNYGQTAGLTGVYSPDTPGVSIQGTQGFGGAGYYNYNNPQWSVPIVGGSVTWIKGTHTFKWGGDFIQDGILENQQANTEGTFNFQNRITGFPNNSNTGWGYASFLLGQVDNASLNSPFQVNYIGRGWAFYGQDEWRATSKLTINYGLRWNMGQPPWEEHDRFGAFEPNVSNPAAGGRLGGISFWGTGAGRNGFRYAAAPNYSQVDPRFGLAYAFDHKTVVRAYYGIISKQVFSDFNNGTTATNYGDTAVLTPSSLNNGLTPAFNWNGGFPGPLPLLPNLNPSFLNGQSVNMLEPTNNEGDRVQAFGINVERSLPGGFLVRGEYLGKMVHGIIRRGGSIFPPVNQIEPKYLSLGNVLLDNINSPQAQAAGIQAPYPGFKGTVAQALRPYPQFLNVDDMDNTGGFTEWNAGHFGLQKRFGTGLSFLVDYTFSKMLVAGPYQDQMQNLDKMLSTNDRPHVLTISYDYQLPFGRGKRYLNSANGVLDRVVGGWEVVGIHSYFSGGIIQMSTTATIPTEERVFPVLVPSVPISTGVSCSNYSPGNSTNRYLNINAFATPAPFTFGNTYELSSVKACGQATENVSLIKNFRINETTRFTLSANAFNLLNRHYWTGLGTNINNPATFGTFNGATPPRIIQLSARVQF